MTNVFHPDSKLMIFFSLAYRIIVLNILTIVFCLPVFTAGASVTALNAVSLKLVRGKDPAILKEFLKSFKDDFWKTTLFWIIDMAIAGLFAWNIYLIVIGLFIFNLFGKIVFSLFFVLFLCVSLWIFILQSRYRNIFRRTLQNAMYLSIRYPIKSFLMVIIGLLPLFIALTISRWSIFSIIAGFSFSGYIQAYIYSPILRQIEFRSIKA